MGKSMQSKVLMPLPQSKSDSEQEANAMYPECRSC